MMRRTELGFGCLIMVGAMAFAGQARAEQVDFEALVGQMTALKRLAEAPDPAYTCAQFSSYDRRSTDPAEATDENWFANHDRGKHLRTEARDGEEEYVLMDAEGPGAIVRIWSANPRDAGHIRIYLDGRTKPEIDVRLDLLLSGKHELAPSPIAGERARGWNCHLPVPYAKHCKVTSTKPDFYYHLNYRTYAAGTRVKTFSVKQARKAEALVRETAEVLRYPVRGLQPPPGAERFPVDVLIESGAAENMAKFVGGGAIYSIELLPRAAALEDALRTALLEITFDGETTVRAPLGDFFGTAPGINKFQSLPCGVRDSGALYAHWVMPYRETAEVRVINRGAAAMSVSGEVTTGPYDWTKDTLLLHAKWRAEHEIPTRPRRDWTFVEAKGRGRYVGNMLHITNPVPDWWGEGDEKIYVDGETFPSTFGTGSEDYYGYAWCNPGLFTHAYHNQPRCDGPGNHGHTCVSRFHLIDDIPFTESLKFDMEVWHWESCEVDQSAVSYWYAAPGGADDFPAIAPAWLAVPEIPDLPSVEGALEGEDMRVITTTAGHAGVQWGAQYDWSGVAQLWWRDAEPGAELVLGFKPEAAGKYEVKAVFTKAPDYGIARVAINGEPAGGEFDFYHTEVVTTAEISLGVHALRAGENQLMFKITGANPEAEPRHMAGLDYLLLKPAE